MYVFLLQYLLDTQIHETMNKIQIRKRMRMEEMKEIDEINKILEKNLDEVSSTVYKFGMIEVKNMLKYIEHFLLPKEKLYIIQNHNKEFWNQGKKIDDTWILKENECTLKGLEYKQLAAYDMDITLQMIILSLKIYYDILLTVDYDDNDRWFITPFVSDKFNLFKTINIVFIVDDEMVKNVIEKDAKQLLVWLYKRSLTSTDSHSITTRNNDLPNYFIKHICTISSLDLSTENKNKIFEKYVKFISEHQSKYNININCELNFNGMRSFAKFTYTQNPLIL